MEGVLKSLARKDKWYVGGGRRLVFAPPFPQWLEAPGFWDEAHFHEYKIQPVFTVTLLDSSSVLVSPRRIGGAHWTPDRWIRRFEYESFSVTETLALGEGDTLVSEHCFHPFGGQSPGIQAVLWTIEDTRPGTGHGVSLVSHQDGVSTYRMDIAGGLWTALALVPSAVSHGVQLSEGSAIQPHWEFTPFAEKWRSGKGLPNTIQMGGINPHGLLYIALHAPVTTTTLWAMRSFGRTKQEAVDAIVASVQAAITPKEEETGRIPTSDVGTASPALRALGEIAADRWNHVFDTVPQFECSDPFIEKYYWYRWYGVHLNTVPGGFGAVKYPAVAEGIAYFRSPISYSAQVLVNEVRWMRDPALARGLILNFLENQRPDGSFPGILRAFPPPGDAALESFYHASWGLAVLELHKIHPDIDFLKQCYEPLARYAKYFDEVRDPEHCGLYDVLNHFETGQEFMRRYHVVNENADQQNWGSNFRLKGVDATVYLYETKRALAWIAAAIGRDEDAARWNSEADAIKRAVLQLMWDPTGGMFFDVDPRTMQRTGVKAAICFYPYRTDIASDDHLDGLKRHLLNPAEFWTPYPVPSSSADDPMFSAKGEWKGKRMVCPWNGRVWPMTNSHIVDALGHSAYALDPSLKPRLAEFLQKYVRMMFFKKPGSNEPDVGRPNCFEHYNPLSGVPSVYRGIDDYMHSWVADHIIRYVAGLQPELDGVLIVDPLPLGLKHLTLGNVPYKGHLIGIKLDGDTFEVYVDGSRRASSSLGTRSRIEL